MKGRFPCKLLFAVLATFGATLAHALSGGPDGFGYTYADSAEPDGPVYDFIDISASGTPVFPSIIDDPLTAEDESNIDDAVSDAIPIGFPFNFYDLKDNTSVYVSSNGFLSFLSGQPDGCCTGKGFPTPGDPNAVVAAWWGDLKPGDFDGVRYGSIVYETRGTAPNRVFIVQFSEVPFWELFIDAGSDRTTHQYKLFEGSDIIEVHYAKVEEDQGHTAGIENQTGTYGLQYLDDEDFETCADPDIDTAICTVVQYRPPNSAPDCTAAVPGIKLLWPPNHKYRPVHVLGVTDPDGDPVTITIDSIFQDEPTNTFGDGNTRPDGKGVGTSVAQVRAERSGTKKVPGDGRFYHINFTANDGNNAECSGEVSVVVPHDRGRKGRNPIDGGPIYDSTFYK